MKMDAFAFGTTNWAELERTEHRGETGVAYWRTCFFGEKPNQIRVRMVEYTPGYLADHWCQKGHILFCMEGELETTLEEVFTCVLPVHFPTAWHHADCRGGQKASHPLRCSIPAWIDSDWAPTRARSPHLFEFRQETETSLTTAPTKRRVAVYVTAA
jgi:hypothetical protein